MHTHARQPAKVVCVEYPKDAGKEDAYAWVCLVKAAHVADLLLGARPQVSSAHFPHGVREGEGAGRAS